MPDHRPSPAAELSGASSYRSFKGELDSQPAPAPSNGDSPRAITAAMKRAGAAAIASARDLPPEELAAAIYAAMDRERGGS